MKKKSDNIELRSEKTRSLIGEIPPIIIRIGIPVIFFVILGLLVFSKYFKYEYTINTTAIIEQKGSLTFINIKIPASKIIYIKKGQKVILNFDNIKGTYNTKMITEIQEIPLVLNVSYDNSYFISKIILPKMNTITTYGKKLNIVKSLNIECKIITKKRSLLNRVLHVMD
jgi:hypothetical protein